MIFYVFDMSIVDPDQVRELINLMAKSGLTGGIYLWLNKSRGKMYVGSTLNFKRRMKAYFGLTQVHGVIGNALRKYGLVSFTLILVFVPNATKELVLSLEQSVLDNWVCAYNISPTAGSTAGVKHSEKAKASWSTSQKGEGNNNYNKGSPVHLIQVTPSGLKHVVSFPNKIRAAEALGVHRLTVTYRLKNKVAFLYNGSDHFLTLELPSNLLP